MKTNNNSSSITQVLAEAAQVAYVVTALAAAAAVLGFLS